MDDSGYIKRAKGKVAEINYKRASGNFIGNESVFPNWLIVTATCCVKLVKIYHCILKMGNLHLKLFSDHWLWRNRKKWTNSCLCLVENKLIKLPTLQDSSVKQE